MGTRNLTVVVVDGQHKIAQYGQWDGYPSGQGATVIEFLHQANLPEFKERVKRIRYGSKEELTAIWAAAGADPNSPWVSMDVVERLKATTPELSRDTGAGILELVATADRDIILRDDYDFAGSSSCEFAYVIDLDKNKLEVYTGYHHDTLTEEDRFFPLESSDSVKKVIEFDLNNLPSEAEFIEAAEEACGLRRD